MIYKALVIPADPNQPLRLVDYDEAAPLGDLIGLEDNNVGISTFTALRFQFVYDDIGLFRTAPVTNRRAMLLWAAAVGRDMGQFVQPLVGDYAVLGLNPDNGETTDVSPMVRTTLDVMGAK